MSQQVVRPVTGRQLPRRAVLLGAAAGLGVALVGCADNQGPPTALVSPTLSTPPLSAGVGSAEAELAALEAQFGGRLGVYAVDTGSGITVAHRAEERFLMCSTHKALSVAAILALRAQQPGLLARLIRYDQSQVSASGYAPVTSGHIADGMTVSALCEAALTQSDNTAANLVLDLLGGPPGLTAFTRTLGDKLTRSDRTEPELNRGAPGDERDTSTPAQMATDLRVLALGDGLDPAGRELFTGWLMANTTGGKLIRAGLPADWRVGDKTGSGSRGEVNDIAVVWPPDRSPLVMAIYTAPDNPNSTAGQSTVASAAAIVAKTLAPA